MVYYIGLLLYCLFGHCSKCKIALKALFCVMIK